MVSSKAAFERRVYITRVVALEWTPEALLNLVIRRLLKNRVLVESFGIDRDAVLRDFQAQNELFYRFFPDSGRARQSKAKDIILDD